MTRYVDSSQISHGLPSALLQGPFNTKEVRIPSGQNLAAFSILGQKLKNTIVEDHTGNTGDGVMSGLAFKKDAVVGDYIIECVEVITNSGRFKVIAPNGDRLDDATVAVAYSNDHLAFTIADGGTDFIAGDTFTITVAAPASEEFILSTAAAVDGSEIPDCILDEAIDTTAGAKTVLAYETGTFGSKDLSFGAGHSVASVKEALHDKGIIIQDSKS